MKIWPIAPQAANDRIAGRTAGLRWMNETAAENSEGSVPFGERGVGGRRGERRRYSVVRSVERTFWATIICGPV